jgi:methionyl aminopeptidase
MIHLKSKREIEILRESNQIVVCAFKALEKMIRPGISTMELNRVADREIRKKGAEPAFKGYRGYPASICASINEQVVHGIPNKRRLREGDIISIDLGVLYSGFYGDAAKTFAIGKVGQQTNRLLQVTEEALYKGIDKARVGNRLRDISEAIQSWVESHGFSVVREFVGHGIGRQLHEEPQVPNFVTPDYGTRRLEEGMVIALEPMVNIGSSRVKVLSDGWTAVTVDGSLSAHFEHSIAVTGDGPDILSLFPETSH